MKKRITKAEKERIAAILDLLDKHYSTDVKIYLNHETPWQLLIATILSAQCTDDRVNLVTKDLFQKYKTLEDFANADIKELEADFFVISHIDRVIDELTKLAGVGRKTANVIRGNIYKEPSIVVDTHVKRISQKLGFTNEEDPVKIEYDLMDILPKDHWIRYNIQIITHGRTICVARRPKCEQCFLNGLCKEGKISTSVKGGKSSRL